MLWLLFSLSALAQNEPDLEAVRKIGKDLPSTPTVEKDEDLRYRVQKRRYKRPYRPIGLEEIMMSGFEHGFLKKGTTLVSVEDNSSHKTTEDMYAKFFRLQDEQGFKYLQNNDKTCSYKVPGEQFQSIEKELVLYEPPHRYTPAPKNIHRNEYDKEFKVLPEVGFNVGFVQSDYMKDLFNDNKAGRGYSTQYSVMASTRWKHPIKVGGVLNYERAFYKVSDGGKLNYSSTSFGPLFRSRIFHIGEFPLRFQTQFRVSPFARLNSDAYGRTTRFKFNSSDLLLSLDHPVPNDWGNFMIGVFFQSQWLNLKDQPETVRINATNETNRSVGLSFSQVFE